MFPQLHDNGGQVWPPLCSWTGKENIFDYPLCFERKNSNLVGNKRVLSSSTRWRYRRCVNWSWRLEGELIWVKNVEECRSFQEEEASSTGGEGKKVERNEGIVWRCKVQIHKWVIKNP